MRIWCHPTPQPSVGRQARKASFLASIAASVNYWVARSIATSPSPKMDGLSIAAHYRAEAHNPTTGNI